MEFSIVINKQANFYFFVQNLSEWHFSCRKRYNVFWTKELGDFSKEEKNALKRFKEIHLKYTFGKLYLGRHFFIEKNPWETISKKLSDGEYKEIKDTFLLLEKKFEKLYKKDYLLLENWKSILEKSLNNQKDTINNILSKIYNINPLEKDINIYLLFSSDDQSGGGANINDRSISVEVSRCHFDQKNRIAGIIWHELIHLYFEKKYFLNLLNEKFGYKREKISLIKEMTDSLLFPNGVLGKSLLGVKRTSLNARISIDNKDKLIKLTEEYVKEKKKFDNSYIEKIYNSVKNT